MLRLSLASRLSKWLSGLTLFFASLAALVGGLLKLDPKEYEGVPTFKAALSFSHRWAWLSVPGLLIIAALLQHIKSEIGSRNTWRSIQFILDRYRDVMFDKHATAKDDPGHHHRVTLFKHVRWRWAFCKWPWTGWMIPVGRSGHATHGRDIPRFRAHPDHPEQAEGVAGQAFVRNKTVAVSNLPLLNKATALTEREQYARRGFVTQEWIQKNRLNKENARSLLGIPVEVKNKPWGALVIDSRSPDEINRNKRMLNSPSHKTLTEVLGKLLE